MVMIAKVSAVVIKKMMCNAYTTARMMPMILAALMFEAQQQGILENLKKKRKLDYTNSLVNATFGPWKKSCSAKFVLTKLVNKTCVLV